MTSYVTWTTYQLAFWPSNQGDFSRSNLCTTVSRRYKAKFYLEIGILNQSRSEQEYDQIVQEFPMDDLSILPMMPVQFKVPNLQGGTLLNSSKIRQVESWNWDAKPGLI